MKIEHDKLLSVSKGKKNSARSKFFSALMKRLAGDRGDAVSEAFVSGDAEKFQSAFGKIVKELNEEARKEKK